MSISRSWTKPALGLLFLALAFPATQAGESIGIYRLPDGVLYVFPDRDAYLAAANNPSLFTASNRLMQGSMLDQGGLGMGTGLGGYPSLGGGLGAFPSLGGSAGAYNTSPGGGLPFAGRMSRSPYGTGLGNLGRNNGFYPGGAMNQAGLAANSSNLSNLGLMGAYNVLPYGVMTSQAGASNGSNSGGSAAYNSSPFGPVPNQAGQANLSSNNLGYGGLPYGPSPSQAGLSMNPSNWNYLPALGLAGGFNPYGAIPYYSGALASLSTYTIPQGSAGSAVTSLAAPPQNAALANPNVATVEIRVPKDATVWLQGKKMSQKGNVRDFVTPPLEWGKSYTYDVKASWYEDGYEVTLDKQLKVRPSDHQKVTFLETPSTEEPAKSEK